MKKINITLLVLFLFCFSSAWASNLSLGIKGLKAGMSEKQVRIVLKKNFGADAKYSQCFPRFKPDALGRDVMDKSCMFMSTRNNFTYSSENLGMIVVGFVTNNLKFVELTFASNVSMQEAIERKGRLISNMKTVFESPDRVSDGISAWYDGQNNVMLKLASGDDGGTYKTRLLYYDIPTFLKMNDAAKKFKIRNGDL